MTDFNPFNRSRSYFVASLKALAIAVFGLSLTALTAEGIIPGFFAWPGVALFVIGWVAIGYVWIERLVKAIRDRRR